MARIEGRRKRARRGKQRRRDKPQPRAFAWRREWLRENKMRYTLFVRVLSHPKAEPVALELIVTRHPFNPKAIAAELRKLHNMALEMRRAARSRTEAPAP